MSTSSILRPEFFITCLPADLQSQVTSPTFPSKLAHQLHEKETSLEKEVQSFIQPKLEEFIDFAKFLVSSQSLNISTLNDNNDESDLKLEKITSPMSSTYEPSSNRQPLKSSLKPSGSSKSSSKSSSLFQQHKSSQSPTNESETESSTLSKPVTPKKKVMFSDNDQVAILPSIPEVSSISPSLNEEFPTIGEIFGHAKDSYPTLDISFQDSFNSSSSLSPVLSLSSSSSASSTTLPNHSQENPELSAADEDVVSHSGFFYNQNDSNDQGDDDDDIYTDYTLPGAPEPISSDNFIDDDDDDDDDDFSLGTTPSADVLNALQTMAEKSQVDESLNSSSLENTEESSIIEPIDSSTPKTDDDDDDFGTENDYNTQNNDNSDGTSTDENPNLSEINKQAEKIQENAIKNFLPQSMTTSTIELPRNLEDLAKKIESEREANDEGVDGDNEHGEDDDEDDNNDSESEDDEMFEFDESLESKAAKSKKPVKLAKVLFDNSRDHRAIVGSLQPSHLFTHKYGTDYHSKENESDEEDGNEDSEQVLSNFSTSLPIQITKPKSWTPSFTVKKEKTSKMSGGIMSGISSMLINNPIAEKAEEDGEKEDIEEAKTGEIGKFDELDGIDAIDDPLLYEDIRLFTNPRSATQAFPQRGMDPSSMSFVQRLTLEKWGSRKPNA